MMEMAWNSEDGKCLDPSKVFGKEIVHFKTKLQELANRASLKTALPTTQELIKSVHIFEGTTGVNFSPVIQVHRQVSFGEIAPPVLPETVASEVNRQFPFIFGLNIRYK